MAGKLVHRVRVSQIKIERKVGSKISSPRGEGGEGRVRNWEYIQYCRISFVHVFNGYVASLSNTLTETNDL
jgi:hypothetical protein